MKMFDPDKPESIEPIPIKRLGNRIILVDGHTRAFAALLHNLPEVLVYWEDEELDWEEYRICVEWCRREGIHTIADLKNRVVPQKDYEAIWYGRCEKMQKELETKRERKND